MSQAQGKTFSDLGIPFPLYAACADSAVEYSGLKTCILCGTANQHCFSLGIGAHLITNCPACNTPNALDAADRDDVACSKCATAVSFVPHCEEDELEVCYNCLRSGKAAFTKDTPLGMIRWEDANRGLTHGRPGEIKTDFELGPTCEEGWTSVRVPQEILFELVRTPTYSTIQGDQWQFCCKQPMIYLGEWTREDFNRKAESGKGRDLFEATMQDTVPGLWEDELHDTTGIYVFRCGSCQKMTAHWDLA